MNSSLRLDYVSPLPPVRSGIADYSLDLLPELASLCDLRVICLDNQSLPQQLQETCDSAPAADLATGDRTPLYHMGNNHHHVQIWHLAHQIPGILTLHDLVLHHLLVEVTLGENDFESYAERLQKDHGWLGESVAHARQWHELGNSAMFGVSGHRTLLRRQRGVLVHSEWAARTLREEDDELSVRVVPMGIPLPDLVEPKNAAAWREEKGIPPAVPLLGTFGFQTPIKRTDRAIAALSHPRLQDAHLAIGGEISGKLDLKRQARGAGVLDRVHFLGFLDFDEFQTAIAACDLCLNLRYPSAGETSASLLRELALGRPVVVSDYAQFADFPDTVALKVPLGDGEEGHLGSAIGEVLRDTDRIDEMAAAARRYIEREHDPKRAAESAVSACLELVDLEPPGDKPPPKIVPTSFLWRKLHGEIQVRGVDEAWPIGEQRKLTIHLANNSLARWLAAEHDVGGVMVGVHWRQEPKDAPNEQQWLPLPHPLDPGESIELQLEIRRPPENSRFLVVEPHLREICGFNAVEGPTWEMELS